MFADASGKFARPSVGEELLGILVDDIQDEHLYLELCDDLNQTDAPTVHFIDIIFFRREALCLCIVASLTT
jgi:hypothetical protein